VQHLNGCREINDLIAELRSDLQLHHTESEHRHVVGKAG